MLRIRHRSHTIACYFNDLFLVKVTIKIYHIIYHFESLPDSKLWYIIIYISLKKLRNVKFTCGYLVIRCRVIEVQTKLAPLIEVDDFICY